MPRILPRKKLFTISNLLYLVAIIICISAGAYMYKTFGSNTKDWVKFSWEALAVSSLLIILGINLEK